LQNRARGTQVQWLTMLLLQAMSAKNGIQTQRSLAENASHSISVDRFKIKKNIQYLNNWN
jgi:hypothetical protein